jgi:ferredoxin-NADP reductase
VRELYDLDHLYELADRHPWLGVIAAVSEDDHHPHAVGMVADIALLRSPDPAGHEIYVCGSREMVDGTRARLHAAGCPPDRVHHESFVGLADGFDKPDRIDGIGIGIDGGAAHLESER